MKGGLRAPPFSFSLIPYLQNGGVFDCTWSVSGTSVVKSLLTEERESM